MATSELTAKATDFHFPPALCRILKGYALKFIAHVLLNTFWQHPFRPPFRGKCNSNQIVLLCVRMYLSSPHLHLSVFGFKVPDPALRPRWWFTLQCAISGISVFMVYLSQVGSCSEKGPTLKCSIRLWTIYSQKRFVCCIWILIFSSCESILIWFYEDYRSNVWGQ